MLPQERVTDPQEHSYKAVFRVGYVVLYVLRIPEECDAVHERVRPELEPFQPVWPGFSAVRWPSRMMAEDELYTVSRSLQGFEPPS